MRIFAIRFVNTKSINNVITKVRTELPIYVSPHREIIYRKVTDINNWYTRIIGLDEVKLYQDRVVELQERLLMAQEQRREIARNLADVRQKSNQIQDEIHKMKREDDLDKFLNLMKEETELMKLEKSITREFQQCDQHERELFTAFTNAIRDSHEKQRAQLEYTKYFGIILSIAGSFLAFCYSTVRKNDLKKYIGDNLAQTTPSNIVNNNEQQQIVETVQSEIQKISELWNTKWKETNYHYIEMEKEQRTRQNQILITVGCSALAIVIIKLITTQL